MILSWMLYALLVGVLVAVAAWMVEAALRFRGIPGRWVWAGALLATVGLIAAAPGRAGGPVGLPMEVAVTTAADGGRVDAGTSPDLAVAAWRALHTVQGWVDAPLGIANALLTSLPLGGFDRIVAIGWVAASVGLLLVFGAALLRFRCTRRTWPCRDLSGASVRVAPAAGPLVAGLLRPEIVVPRWLLTAPAEEQRLVVAHEQEHVRARDPLLLAGSCLMVALLPWHPAVWWMASRLRLAVEVDCDARVLRGARNREAYGSTLLAVASRRSGLLAGAPAFLESPSQLERRLLAMSTRFPRFAAARSVALGTVAAALLLGACEAEMPTTAEIEEMDVVAAERRMRQLQGTALGQDSNTAYLIDGVSMTAEAARSLDPEQIGSIEVIKRGTGDGPNRIMIRTQEALAAKGEDRSEATRAATVRLRAERAARERVVVSAFAGILLIDGQRADPATMRDLPPDAIESIEVVKGAAAERLYDDPKAHNGVIRITTKAAAPQR